MVFLNALIKLTALISRIPQDAAGWRHDPEVASIAEVQLGARMAAGVTAELDLHVLVNQDKVSVRLHHGFCDSLIGCP